MLAEPMTEAESFRRGIFPLTVGGVARLADPMRVMARMTKVEPRFDDLVSQFFTASVVPENETQEDATVRGMKLIEIASNLYPAILAGFELEPLSQDGAGVSITEAIEILMAFQSWQIRKEFARQTAEAEILAAAAEAEAREREAAEAELIEEAPALEMAS